MTCFQAPCESCWTRPRSISWWIIPMLSCPGFTTIPVPAQTSLCWDTLLCWCMLSMCWWVMLLASIFAALYPSLSFFFCGFTLLPLLLCCWRSLVGLHVRILRWGGSESLDSWTPSSDTAPSWFCNRNTDAPAPRLLMSTKNSAMMRFKPRRWQWDEIQATDHA